MTPESIKDLQTQVAAELTLGLAQRASIDEQVKALQTQRKLFTKQIETARSMLRFAEKASAPPSTTDEPKTSPALERAKEAWDAATETVSPLQGPGS